VRRWLAFTVTVTTVLALSHPLSFDLRSMFLLPNCCSCILCSDVTLHYAPFDGTTMGTKSLLFYLQLNKVCAELLLVVAAGGAGDPTVTVTAVLALSHPFV
jgi:hypothetical protein